MNDHPNDLAFLSSIWRSHSHNDPARRLSLPSSPLLFAAFSLPHSLCFSLSLSQELGNLIEEPFSILPLEAMGDGIESSIYEALERDCGLELGQVQTAPYGIWPIFRILHIHTHQTLSRLVHASCESRNGNLTALTEYVSLMQDCEMVDYRSVSSKPSSFVR